MYSKLKVALEELDTLEQPQDSLVTNESELEVAQVVEEIQEEVDELETTEELVAELEKQEAALETLIQGIKAVQNPTEDNVQLVSVAFENIMARIPEMEGSAALIDHAGIRSGIGLEALAQSTPSAVLAVALEEAEVAKKTIFNKIGDFIAKIKNSAAHFIKLLGDGIYRLNNALKKIKAAGFDGETVTIKNKNAASACHDKEATGANLLAKVKVTQKTMEDFSNNFSKYVKDSMTKVVKAEEDDELTGIGEFEVDETTITHGRTVAVEKGVMRVGSKAKYSGDGSITVTKSDFDSLVELGLNIVKQVDTIKKNFGVTHATIERDVKALKSEKTGIWQAKLFRTNYLTSRAFSSFSKVTGVLIQDVKTIISVTNAASKQKGSVAEGDQE